MEKKFLIAFVYLTIMTTNVATNSNVDEKLSPNRIVGGERAKKGELPYQISLRTTYYGSEFNEPTSHICGGTIYNKRYIITAAHCFFRDDHGQVVTIKNVRVIAGEYILSKREKSEQIMMASKIYIHPDYSTKTSENDLAIIKLRRSLNYTLEVQSVPLAEAGHTASGQGVVSGWGLTENEGQGSDYLKKATLNILTDESCRKDYSWKEDDIPDTALCAENPPTDSCQGDSGGPLVCNDTGTKYLCGVVSFGEDCGDKKYPAIYTEISHYRDYITKIAGDQISYGE